MYWLLFGLVMLGLMLGYFCLARRFNIIDIPNHRSSHDYVTIRGGGIIFPLGLLLASLFWEVLPYKILIALLIIATVSFIDDVRSLLNRIRIVAQFLAVGLIFFELDASDLPVWLAAVAFIVIVGTINAYNFMDGINGITVLYSLVTIATLYYLNGIYNYSGTELYFASLVPLIIFAFFNVRKRAKCFAGDVGSISIAFIITYLIFMLIATTGDIKYIGLLLVYGLDAVTTIVFRLYRGENIFDAHRSHFYQYLTSIRGWGHVETSVLYAGIQILVNIVVIGCIDDDITFLPVMLCLGFGFLFLRFMTEGRDRLFLRSTTAD